MKTSTTATLRGLFMAALISIAGAVSIMTEGRAAEALPRDPVASMFQECAAFGGVLEDWSFVDPHGSLVGWYTCTYDFGYEECWDFPGEENFCSFYPDPQPEPDPDPWGASSTTSWYGTYSTSSTATYTYH